MLETIVIGFIFPVGALVLIYCWISPSKGCHLEMLFLTYLFYILKLLYSHVIKFHSVRHTHAHTQMNACKNW